jgi:hypothetical protein
VSKGKELKLMFKCPRDTLHHFAALGESQGKIGGIVIGPTVLHCIVWTKMLLVDKHATLVIALDSSRS